MLTSRKELFHFKLSKKALGLICFALFFFVWNYQNFLLSDFSGTLDNSWEIGLNWAHQLGLPWSGDNMIFTYGPLFYLREQLVFPEFYSPQTIIFLVIGMNVLYTVAFTYVFSLFFNQFLEDKNYLKLIPVFLILLTTRLANYELPYLGIFILLPAILSGSRNGFGQPTVILLARYGIVSFIFAALSFLKFSYLPLSILIGFILVLLLLYRRVLWEAAWLVGTFLFSMAGLWIVVIKQKFSDLPAFWISRLAITGGYTEAMQLKFADLVQQQAFLLSILYIFILALFFMSLLIKKQFNWAVAWLLPLGILFINFKNVFVRADGRETLILQTISFSALYYFYLIFIIAVKDPKLIEWRNSNKNFFILFLALFTISAYSIGKVNLSPSGYFTDFENIFRVQQYDKFAHQVILKKSYPLDSDFLSSINSSKPIDIIPQDIGLLYAYNLPWQPRPVIQSYASYTANLDNLDASYFSGEKAPELLIYSLQSIDNRYPVFDTPKTFRVLLAQYQFVTQSSDSRYALLKNRPSLDTKEWRFVSEQTVKLDEQISIPLIPGSHVFMTVDIQPTLLGSILNIIYKSYPLTVEINPLNIEPAQYRYIRAVGENGLFVSKYVRNLEDVRHIFEDAYYPDIQSLRFLGSNWFYKTSFTVRFYSLPFNQDSLKTPEIINHLEPATGEFLGTLDKYDGQTLRGWALVAGENTSGSKISILLKKDDQVFRIFPSRLQRPDVSTFYNVNKLYDDSGYEVYLPEYNLQPGTYNLGFLVENNGKIASQWEQTTITIPGVR